MRNTILKWLSSDYRTNQELKSENRKLKKKIKYALAQIDADLLETDMLPSHEDKGKQETAIFYKIVGKQDLNRLKNILK